MLPNIDTLIFVDSPTLYLVEAFDTKLEFHDTCEELSVLQQAVRSCSKLQHLFCPALCLPECTTNLRLLHLACALSAADFSALLEHACLNKLQMSSIENIHRDWSGDAYSWEELHISECLDFKMLKSLNLSSLDKVTIAYNAMIRLLDPSDPSSRNAVQHSIANISHVGQIVVKQCTSQKDILRMEEFLGPCMKTAINMVERLPS